MADNLDQKTEIYRSLPEKTKIEIFKTDGPIYCAKSLPSPKWVKKIGMYKYYREATQNKSETFSERLLLKE